MQEAADIGLGEAGVAGPARLLGENGIELPVLYSEHLVGDGQEMFQHAAKLNWERIISKRADAPCRPK
jgi:ATP-dependent DNA ligase